MPWFSLHRNYTLSTNAGHVLNFVKGEVTWVPDACVAMAVAVGAIPSVPLDAALDPIPPESKAAAPIPLSAEERQAKYFDAFEQIILRARRDDFLASGLPHLKKIEELSGLQVSATERDDMWQKYQDSKVQPA